MMFKKTRPKEPDAYLMRNGDKLTLNIKDIGEVTYRRSQRKALTERLQRAAKLVAETK